MCMYSMNPSLGHAEHGRGRFLEEKKIAAKAHWSSRVHELFIYAKTDRNSRLIFI